MLMNATNLRCNWNLAELIVTGHMPYGELLLPLQHSWGSVNEAETIVEASSNVICGKASEDIMIEVNDELCSDSEYLNNTNNDFEKTYWSVEIYPDDSSSSC